jgi:hypothetical protein
VEVNFGEREFKFDIEHYVKVRKKEWEKRDSRPRHLYISVCTITNN